MNAHRHVAEDAVSLLDLIDSAAAEQVDEGKERSAQITLSPAQWPSALPKQEAGRRKIGS